VTARPRPHHAAADVIWVLSDLAPDGESYILSIQAGEDRIFVPQDPVAYVLTVSRAIQYAAYDSAVTRQMMTVTGGKLELVGEIINDLRGDRPPVDDAATAPLTFDPIVSSTSFDPFIHVALDGKKIGQWTLTDATEHANWVSGTMAVVDLDAAYRRYLIGTLDVGRERACAVIDDLGTYRHPSEPQPSSGPRPPQRDARSPKPPRRKKRR
jgi:hypothetical protein